MEMDEDLRRFCEYLVLRALSDEKEFVEVMCAVLVCGAGSKRSCRSLHDYKRWQRATALASLGRRLVERYGMDTMIKLLSSILMLEPIVVKRGRSRLCKICGRYLRRGDGHLMEKHMSAVKEAVDRVLQIALDPSTVTPNACLSVCRFLELAP